MDQKTNLIIASMVAVAISLAICLFSPFLALAVFLGIALFILSLYQPKIGIFILAGYTPFEPFVLKYVPDEFYVYAKYAGEVFMLVLLGAIIFKLAYQRKLRLPQNPINIPLVLFICLAFVSMLLNLESPMIWALGLRQTLRYLVLFYIIMLVGLDKKAIKQLLTLMLFIVVLEISVGYIQAVVGAPADQILIPSAKKSIGEIQVAQEVSAIRVPGQRISATLGRYDQLGTFLCFFMVMSLGLVYQYKTKMKYQLYCPYILGFIVFASLPALILTYSRMSWLGFIAGLILVALIFKRDKKIAIALIVLVCFIGLYYAYSRIPIKRLEDAPRMTIMERFFEMFSPKSIRGSYTYLGRLYFIVQTPLKVVKNYPLFGVGPGRYGGGVAAALNNREVYDQLGLPFGIQGKGGQIDNNWMSLWGETGTLGLLCFAWMILALFWAAWQVYRRSTDSFLSGLALGYMGCVVAVTIQAFLGAYFEVRTLALYFWLFGGIICYQKYLLDRSKGASGMPAKTRGSASRTA